VTSNMTDSAAADIARATALTDQALVASPRCPLAHFAKAQPLRAQRRFAEAIPEYEAVLASDRNWVYASFALGQCKHFTGSAEEAISLIERAVRLSPRDPEVGVWYENIGDVHLLESRTDQAIIWLEKARNHTPEHSIIRGNLAAAYGLAGEIERAATELAEARRLSPDDRYSSIARHRILRNYGPCCQKSAPSSKPPVSPGCAKPECLRSDWRCRLADVPPTVPVADEILCRGSETKPDWASWHRQSKESRYGRRAKPRGGKP